MSTEPIVTSCPIQEPIRYLRFPIGGHLVTITVEPEEGQRWTAEDIDEVKAMLDIWRKGQARIDERRAKEEPPAPAEEG